MRNVRLLAVGLMFALIAAADSVQPLLWGQGLFKGDSSQSLLLGADDGFACALFFGSDLDGNLEPCG